LKIIEKKLDKVLELKNIVTLAAMKTHIPVRFNGRHTPL